jgi:hypothetical protein
MIQQGEKQAGPVRMRFYIPIMLLVMALSVGCAPHGREPKLSDLEGCDPALKIRAVKLAGENELISAVAPLVDLLQDEDRAVRYYAIASLRRITGTDHGYDFKADAGSRAEAVARWREELNQKKTQSVSWNRYDTNAAEHQEKY